MDFKTGTIRSLQEYVAFKNKEHGFTDEAMENRLILSYRNFNPRIEIPIRKYKKGFVQNYES